MMISKKWKAAAAAFLALALVGGSSVAANAAPGDALNPQPNGSEGGLYIYNGDTEQLISDPAHVFDRSDAIIGSGSATDFQANILGTEANTTLSTNAYTFVSSAAKIRATGKNSWEAYSQAGLIGGKAKTAYLTPGDSTDSNSPGIDGVFADVGGTYYLGVAYTKNNGVTVDSAIYRTMTILADGKFTLAPVELEAAVAVTPPTEADIAAAPGLATTIPAPAVGSTVLNIDLGVANANKTLNVGAYSTYTDLGTVTLDANGQGTVDVAGAITDAAQHTLVLWETDGTLVAHGTFALTSPTLGSNPLTVAVTTSEKFELVAPAAGTIDLGAVKRNATTTPVALGQFTVIDDRSAQLGWDLNVSANDFVNGANTIAKSALGYSPRAISTLPTGIALGAAKAAGAGDYGSAISGAANSSTAEAGLAFDLDLTFKSPIDAAAGTYASTLTLDLQSK